MFETLGKDEARKFCEQKENIYRELYKTLEVVISTGYTSQTQKEKSCSANGVVCLFHLIINKQISGREAQRRDPILCAMFVYNTCDGKCGRRRAQRVSAGASSVECFLRRSEWESLSTHPHHYLKWTKAGGAKATCYILCTFNWLSCFGCISVFCY